MPKTGVLKQYRGTQTRTEIRCGLRRTRPVRVSVAEQISPLFCQGGFCHFLKYLQLASNSECFKRSLMPKGRSLTLSQGPGHSAAVLVTPQCFPAWAKPAALSGHRHLKPGLLQSMQQCTGKTHPRAVPTEFSHFQRGWQTSPQEKKKNSSFYLTRVTEQQQKKKPQNPQKPTKQTKKEIKAVCFKAAAFLKAHSKSLRLSIMNTFNVFFRLLLNHFFQCKESSPGGCSYASCIYYQGIETATDGEK